MYDNSRKVSNVEIEDCEIIFKNFSGAEGQFNSAGNRNFGVILTPEVAEAMEADGWNIKYLKPRNEGDDPTPWLKVKVVYGKIPPKIYMVTSKNKRGTLLTEDTVGSIDFAEIEKVDIIIRPYTYNVNGKSGISAYVQTMYVTIAEDNLTRKYNAYADEEEEDLPWN